MKKIHEFSNLQLKFCKYAINLQLFFRELVIILRILSHYTYNHFHKNFITCFHINLNQFHSTFTCKTSIYKCNKNLFINCRNI